MKKRLLSLLLVIVLIAGLLPAGAMAAQAGPAAEWYNFRNSDVNMGITSAQTPKSAAYTQLEWTSSFGEYVGIPLLIDGYMYVAAGNAADNSKLYKLSLSDGSVVSSSSLAIAYSSNNCNVAMTYVQEKGLIIVPLTDGVIQAFNISDLSSAWVYQDKSAETANVAGAQTNPKGMGGQLQTPIVYSEGKLFGGFYVSSTGNLVCLDAETGALQWYYPSEGGFYWAGAVSVGDYIVCGSEKGNGKLLMFAKTQSVDAADPKAEPCSSLELLAADGAAMGNQRSSMAYDKAGGRVYFTTASGYICSAAVDGENGQLSDLVSYRDEISTSSTNTPIVYGDYVYYGAGKYNNFHFIVANKGSLETVAKVKLPANPQGSFLLSTAYAGEGYLYFYCTYNAKPGGLDLVKVPTSAPTSETLVLEELYDARGHEEYCICSPICGSDGTIYYRNDSKTIFALGSSDVEVPVIGTDLSTDQVKYNQNAEAQALSIEVSVSDGGELSYLWQSSTDGNTWTDIAGAANEGSYTPSTAELGTTYYRCIVTNTLGGKSASAISSTAEILVKILSNETMLNLIANNSNSLTSGSPKTGSLLSESPYTIVGVLNYGLDIVKYVGFGAANEGSFDKNSFTIYQGLPADVKMPSMSSISSSELYTNRFWRSAGFSLPFVASLEVTAEDGVTKETIYIVIDKDELSSYAIGVSGFSSESEFFSAETGLSFSEKDQSAALTPITVTIGQGEEDVSAWNWSSSDPTVAKVDENGLVTCVGGGEATITFSCGHVTGSVAVKSTAAAHTIHSYVDGVCSVCGTKQPSPITVYFSLVGQDGKFVSVSTGEDNTELYKLGLSVGDEDCDGSLTINDAFIAAHTAYSANGSSDFVTVESAYGAYITRLWGIDTGAVGYFLNDASAMGLSVTVKNKDELSAFFYRDLNSYSDVYTYFEDDSAKGSVGVEKIFTVSASAGGNAVIPSGASVKVYDSTGSLVEGMTATVGSDGSFGLGFSAEGTYTVEVCGQADYTGYSWDSAANEGEGGYVETAFEDAPVIPSRISVEVVPYASKTVYVSIVDKSGSFVVNKNGDEMYRFPVTTTDDKENPDGVITLSEVITAAHEQYHPDGASAVDGQFQNFITKLWGENNGGNASYYFNDLYMSGSGTKTGTNGREFVDRLLATVVEDGDAFYIYSFQSSDWSKGDLYTYFDPVTETAVAGESKTLTAKSAGGYGTNANKLEGSTVKVMRDGIELPELGTLVGEDGSFTITFPSAGTYVVEVRTNGQNYVTPSRCTVTVTAKGTIPGDEGEEDELPETITVYLTLLGDSAHGSNGETHTLKNGGLKTWIPRIELTLSKNANVKTALEKALSMYGYSYSNPTGNYVESVTANGVTLGEFTNGPLSGWKYTLNGAYSSLGVAQQGLEDGDEIVFHYTDDYTVEDGEMGSNDPEEPENPDIPVVPDDPDEPEQPDNPDEPEQPDDPDQPDQPVQLPFTDVYAEDWFYDSVKYVYENGLMNGVSDTEFEPASQLSRAMLATIIYRLEGEPKVKGENPFEDVADGQWYTDAIIWAAENGIVIGYGDGSFGPMDKLSREQMAVMLHRYCTFKLYEKAEGADLSAFKDADEISVWALEAMAWANAEGLVNGRSADTLTPGGDASRAEAAAILMRFVENIVKAQEE